MSPTARIPRCDAAGDSRSDVTGSDLTARASAKQAR